VAVAAKWVDSIKSGYPPALEGDLFDYPNQLYYVRTKRETNTWPRYEAREAKNPTG